MASYGDTFSDETRGEDDIYSIGAWFERQRDEHSVEMVPISSLKPSDSPRLGGENVDHVLALAESNARLPPIIVSRCTMRIIDGVHRLRAAVLRGQDKVEVRFFDGNEEDAFILAVEANIKHGLPLSMADRAAAAARIITSHPHWSDRAIASSTGLSAKTVRAIRQRSSSDNYQSKIRVGRDGRVRPLDAREGRRLAAELMADQPNVSLRAVASAAGISLGTAQNVRERLRRGSDPVVPTQREYEQKNQTKRERQPSRLVDRIPAEDCATLIRQLRTDPSLRFTDVGRLLIRLLEPLALVAADWERFIDQLPNHCTSTVSDAARACARAWQEFAERLELRQ